ncbi:MAG: hypothetical protein OEM59_17040 [Rhodospirillales bacterium]|nr:hypothetical protein [Rhodospirillales bacterium]
MRPVSTLLLFLAASVALAGGALAAPAPSAGCGTAPPETPGITATRTLEVGGFTRSYDVHLPLGYDQATPTPLVLSFHGYEGTAAGQEAGTGMSAHADAKGYIVVYPQATAFPTDDRLGYIGGEVATWNDLACSGSPGPQGPICSPRAFNYPVEQTCLDQGKDDCNWCTCAADDVAFVAAMLDDLESDLCVDLGRVYATGFSNGGMLTHRLGCNLAHRFAAIAPVSGTLSRGYNCAPPAGTKLSLMHIHGLRDRVVPYDGRSSSDGFFYTAVADVVALWALSTSQGCAAVDTPYPTSADGTRMLACSERAGCTTGAEVVQCLWNQRHSWPATQDGRAFGNDIIWEFFQANGG